MQLIKNPARKAIRRFKFENIDHNGAIIYGFEKVLMFHQRKITGNLLIRKAIWLIKEGNPDL
jgi:hypothetical protein